MNNNISNYIKDDIGTDPTVVPIIESLDANNTNNINQPVQEENQPKEHNHEKLKNILFVFITIVLICGVGYGIFYYLNLARKKTTFILNDIISTVGDTLSTNIGDYGTFNSSTITSCHLDLSAVDISQAGTYTYSVECNDTKKSASIIVKEKEEDVTEEIESE